LKKFLSNECGNVGRDIRSKKKKKLIPQVFTVCGMMKRNQSPSCHCLASQIIKNKPGVAGSWWLTPVILVMQEAEIRRTEVQS
jgi:hypothetical protein